MLKEIEFYLNDIFENNLNLVNTFGISNTLDSKFMLIADLLSESIEDFALVVNEEFLFANTNTANQRAVSFNYLSN